MMHYRCEEESSGRRGEEARRLSHRLVTPSVTVPDPLRRPPAASGGGSAAFGVRRAQWIPND